MSRWRAKRGVREVFTIDAGRFRSEVKRATRSAARTGTSATVHAHPKGERCGTHGCVRVEPDAVVSTGQGWLL